MNDGLLIAVGSLCLIGGVVGFVSAATIIGQCAALLAALCGLVAVIGGSVVGEMRRQTKLLQFLCDRHRPVGSVSAPLPPQSERGGLKGVFDRIIGPPR